MELLKSSGQPLEEGVVQGLTRTSSADLNQAYQAPCRHKSLCISLSNKRDSIMHHKFIILLTIMVEAVLEVQLGLV
jgi:hypothetical protein